MFDDFVYPNVRQNTLINAMAIIISAVGQEPFQCTYVSVELDTSVVGSDAFPGLPLWQ